MPWVPRPVGAPSDGATPLAVESVIWATSSSSSESWPSQWWTLVLRGGLGRADAGILEVPALTLDLERVIVPDMVADGVVETIDRRLGYGPIMRPSHMLARLLGTMRRGSVYFCVRSTKRMTCSVDGLE